MPLYVLIINNEKQKIMGINENLEIYFKNIFGINYINV